MSLKSWKKSQEKDYIALWEHKSGKKDVFVAKRTTQFGELYTPILEIRGDGDHVKHIEICKFSRDKNVAIRKAYNYVKRH